MRILVFISLFFFTLNAKTITPNEVYAQTMLIAQHTEYLLKHYEIPYDSKKLKKETAIFTKLKPRNAWQNAYEILVKINVLRGEYGLPRIEPIGMEPVEHLNPDMVYEMTQRILVEMKIFEVRQNIVMPHFKLRTFKYKTPLDVYNNFSYISALFDKLNKSELSPSYVFAATMRIYNDITLILHHLKIRDNTVPSKKLKTATPNDSLKVSLQVLNKIKKLQSMAGIQTIDTSVFDKKNAKPSDVYTVTGLILAELQPIKAYIGLIHSVTPPPLRFENKIPADIEQLMGWNLKRISLIRSLNKR